MVNILEIWTEYAANRPESPEGGDTGIDQFK